MKWLSRFLHVCTGVRRSVGARSSAALLLASTAACLGTAAHATSGPVSLWYQRGATPDQQRILQNDLVAPFNAANPGNTLTLDVRSANGDQQIRMAVLASRGPDVVMTPGPSYALSLVQSGHLIPLDAYIQKYHLDQRILAPAFKAGLYQGHVYALPRTFETMVLYYNKTLFDKNGWKPPKTLADLNALAAAMQAKGITPFSVGNGDWRAANEWHVTWILNHYAGPDNVYKALKGELPWTAPVFQQAIGMLNDWYQKGWFGKEYFSLTSDQQALRLAKGQAGMAPNGTFSFDFMTKAFAQTGQELGVAAIPSLRDGVPYPTYEIGIGSTFSINKASANPDGAAALLNYIYSDAFYDRISKDWPGDWNLPLNSVNQDRLAHSVSPLFATTVTDFSKAVRAGNYGYTTWTYWPPATEDYLVRGMEQVWLKQITVAQYLQTMQNTFAGELKAGKVPPLAPR